MAWGWRRLQKRSAPLLSISDPAVLSYFGVVPTDSGVTVTESTALATSAVWRACSLIGSTIASLPLKTYRDVDADTRQQVSSLFDDPGGLDGPTPFEWKETCIWHALLHGDAFLQHVFNGAGGLAALIPVHPQLVTVEWDLTRPGRKRYTAPLPDGTRKVYDAATMTQIMGPSMDGLRGMGVISVARNSLGTTIAGERAAARRFGNGGMIAGLVSAEEDISDEEAKDVKAGLDAKLKGWENAGDIAFVNRKLKFTPWMMNAADAQFLESRQFQIEEIARWFGIPPFELMQTEKQTSWGTGIESQQRGLARTVLMPWTLRFEQRLSRLLAKPRFVEFEFAGLERPTPEQEIALLIQQVQAGILTVNEARKIRNLSPIRGGDLLGGAPTPTPDELAGVAA